MDNPDLIFTADAHTDGAVLRVKDINGVETSITITLQGVHSKAWRDIVAKRDKQFISSNGNLLIPEEEMFAEVTIGWENMPNPNRGDDYGKEFEFSKENARLMYEKSPIIFEQVNSFIANNVNFMKGSAGE